MSNIGFRNHLLMCLPDEARAPFAMAAQLQKFEKESVVVLCSEFLFIEAGIVSMLSADKVESALEILIIGRDGIGGIDFIAVDAQTNPKVFKWKTRGEAYIISKSNLMPLVRKFPEVKRLTDFYLTIYLNQLIRQSVCARKHALKERIVSTILTTVDSCDTDFLLTQESIANRLDVSRTAVNEIAGQLAKEGNLKYVRGRITILDRQKLNSQACECYRALLDEKAKILFTTAETNTKIVSTY